MNEVSDYHAEDPRPQKKRRKYIAKAWYALYFCLVTSSRS